MFSVIGVKLTFDSDMESTPAVRMLRAGLNRSGIMDVVFRLWRELGLMATMNRRPGLITKEQLPLVQETLGSETWRQLVTCGLVREAEGGWWCEQFHDLNRNMLAVPHHERIGRKGGLKRNIDARLRRDEESLGLFDQTMRLEDGTVLDAVKVKAARQLVLRLDGMLARPDRREDEFTTGLLADAWRVIVTRQPDQYRSDVELMMDQFDHEVFQNNVTEKVLADWDTITGKLRSES